MDLFRGHDDDEARGRDRSRLDGGIIAKNLSFINETEACIVVDVLPLADLLLKLEDGLRGRRDELEASTLEGAEGDLDGHSAARASERRRCGVRCGRVGDVRGGAALRVERWAEGAVLDAGATPVLEAADMIWKHDAKTVATDNAPLKISTFLPPMHSPANRTSTRVWAPTAPPHTRVHASHLAFRNLPIRLHPRSPPPLGTSPSNRIMSLMSVPTSPHLPPPQIQSPFVLTTGTVSAMSPPAFCLHLTHPFLPRPRRTSLPHHHPPLCTAAPATRPAGRVLSPSATPTRFDSGALSAPCVQRYLSDSGPRYVMWYAGRPRNWASSSQTPPDTGDGLVGLALSVNGLSWERVDGPLDMHAVLAPNDDWWAFDTVRVGLGSVSVDSTEIVRADGGVYFMYYAGGNAEKVTVWGNEIAGARSAIGVAISKDGEYFTRLEGEWPSGAVLERGAEGAFDELFVAGPCVVKVREGGSRGKYVMHYFSLDKESKRFAIGQARSKDGLRFERVRTTPVVTGEGFAFAERGVSRCCVVEREAGRFVMFVECVDGDGVHRIAVTESVDCGTWGALKVVLEPEEGDAWDGNGVSHPSVVKLDDDRVRLYYVGRGHDFDADEGIGTGIGVAESGGGDWTRLQRVAMRPS